MKKKIPIKLTIVLIIIVAFFLGGYLPQLIQKYIAKNQGKDNDPQLLTQKVIPQEGVNLNISFGDSVLKMVEMGAIDKQKFDNIYKGRGGLTQDLASVFDGNSNTKITVNQDNAGILLNLLWPLGLSNKTEFMNQSPMGKEYASDIENFASTGGWTLGKVSGGKLFNNLPIVPLTREQEQIVAEISQNIYRPCCGNSTYFPDCNHGAAMLGFLYLAVSQGIPKDEIYKKALALNSYWFPQTYVELATYFEGMKDTAWNKVDPKEVLGAGYSSGQGYVAISKQLQEANLVPQVSGGGSCSV
ncbi:hypothetical protein HYT02_05450 [Candidatus Gottesmanbacteria bacterium]|nr:hypothetical protein [Candidatus Gottesmanbacteria bacterium]